MDSGEASRVCSLLWIKARTWGLLGKGSAASYNRQPLCFGDRFLRE